MKTEQLQHIADCIKRARQAGREAADACPNDGGSANLDTVYLYGLEGVHQKSMNKAGISCYRKGVGEFFLSGCCFGQGNRNYAGTQAVCKSLQRDGIDCAIWYMLD